MNNEPVAHRFKWEEQEEWQYGDGYDATGAPNDPDYFAYEPLYTKPQKYCPSENNEAYEKGFIDGMAKQRDSAVQRFVEGGTPDSELAEHKRIIREQQVEIEALKLAIVEYADCVDSVEGTDFISHLKYMETSEESKVLLYKLNGYDENGLWIHKRKASEK